MKKTIRLAGIVRESIVDGPGIRFVVFCQGCPHNCPDCHNQPTHDFSGGTETDIEKIIAAVESDPLIHGVTFSGGEPACQPEGFLALAKKLKARNINIWMYSGYTIQQLFKYADPNYQGTGATADSAATGSAAAGSSAAGSAAADSAAAGSSAAGSSVANSSADMWLDPAKRDALRGLLQTIDVLIDGRYVASKRDLTLKYRGSTNQRVIDMKKSLKTGRLTLVDTDRDFMES